MGVFFKLYNMENYTLNTIDKSIVGSINELKKQFAYGVRIYKNNSSPLLERIGNLEFHRILPIQSALRGCIVMDHAIKYYLYSENWNYKEDGTTPSVLDGTDGDVGVEIPNFFLWSEVHSEGDNPYTDVYISLLKLSPYALEVPHMVIGAERCTLDRTNPDKVKARSVVNNTAAFRGGNNNADYDQYLKSDPARSQLQKPATNTQRSIMRTYARNNNAELMCYDWYKAVFYWLWVIEYANLNSQDTFNSELTEEGYHQGGMGNGVTDVSNWTAYNSTYPITPCGYNYEIGSNTGLKNLTLVGNSNQVVSVPRWRGFNNIFGDIWTNLEGSYIVQNAAGDAYKQVFMTHNPEYFDETLFGKNFRGLEIRAAGYIKNFDYRNTAELIPLENGGSVTTYMCDYHYIGNDDITLRTLLVGGYAYNGSTAGLALWDSDGGLAAAAAAVGFRTVYLID